MRCERLKEINIPESVQKIGAYAFKSCPALVNEEFLIIRDTLVVYGGTAEDVTIPDGVTIIGEGAFSGCKWMTGVTIPGSVTEIGDNVFSECEYLRVRTPTGSAAEQYCKENGIPCDLLPPES